MKEMKRKRKKRKRKMRKKKNDDGKELEKKGLCFDHPRMGE